MEEVAVSLVLTSAIQACRAAWQAYSAGAWNREMAAMLCDEWRRLESRLTQLASDNIDAATQAQPLGALTNLAGETAKFVAKYTSRSRAQRMRCVLRDRARMRDLAERLAVLQQRLQLSLHIDATSALRLRERLAEADVADLEVEAKAMQELVEGLG
ncbi:hypothetical protein KFE25_011926 [Diacronema lutheri]|uniref:Uncharacterized protein n=1 Tax=Diacronema lutheri TaxID=2081491 RepID=A0A8J6BZR9_DIALT|nr:hypothetical protein KFE25_011926 [Diacronema lutheri]